MTVDKAFREALGYEEQIRDLYRKAAQAAGCPEARTFFELLGREEAFHVDYLERRLHEWSSKGGIDPEALVSNLPDPARLEAAAKRAGEPLAGRDAGGKSLEGRILGGEEEAMARALKAEEETTAFYKRLAAELPGDEGKLFARFLEIEEGHTRMVRAELDLASRTGYWFDARVFDLED